MMELKVGKRYTCAACGSQALVVKPSAEASLACCDAEMELEAPKQVASSD